MFNNGNLLDSLIDIPFCIYDNDFCESVFQNPDLNNNYTIDNQNIRSLRKNFDAFLLHINSLNNKPDFIFLTET